MDGKRCKQCDALLLNRSKNTCYCSEACKAEQKRATARQASKRYADKKRALVQMSAVVVTEARKTRPCKICQSSIPLLGVNNNQHYCSNECKRLAYNQRNTLKVYKWRKARAMKARQL